MILEHKSNHPAHRYMDGVQFSDNHYHFKLQKINGTQYIIYVPQDFNISKQVQTKLKCKLAQYKGSRTLLFDTEQDAYNVFKQLNRRAGCVQYCTEYFSCPVNNHRFTLQYNQNRFYIIIPNDVVIMDSAANHFGCKQCITDNGLALRFKEYHDGKRCLDDLQKISIYNVTISDAAKYFQKNQNVPEKQQWKLYFSGCNVVKFEHRVKYNERSGCYQIMLLKSIHVNSSLYSKYNCKLNTELSNLNILQFRSEGDAAEVLQLLQEMVNSTIDANIDNSDTLYFSAPKCKQFQYKLAVDEKDGHWYIKVPATLDMHNAVKQRFKMEVKWHVESNLKTLLFTNLQLARECLQALAKISKIEPVDTTLYQRSVKYYAKRVSWSNYQLYISSMVRDVVKNSFMTAMNYALVHNGRYLIYEFKNKEVLSSALYILHRCLQQVNIQLQNDSYAYFEGLQETKRPTIKYAIYEINDLHTNNTVYTWCCEMQKKILRYIDYEHLLRAVDSGYQSTCEGYIYVYVTENYKSRLYEYMEMLEEEIQDEVILQLDNDSE